MEKTRPWKQAEINSETRRKQMTEAQSVVRNVDDQLVVLWASQDREVAMNMVFMYTKNSKRKGWWKNVRLVIWGPSARLMTEDPELQAELAALKTAGVELQACKACADRYGVSEKLADMGVDVMYMGQPLTQYLKSDCTVITV
jgi:hypothetical protein